MGSPDIKHVLVDGHKLSLRMFTKTNDYAMLKAWWAAYNSDIMDADLLPPTGLIVELDDKPASSCFIYRTDGNFCIYDIVIAAPGLEKKQRNIALEFMTDAVTAWAKINGFKYVRAFAKHRKSAARMVKRGSSLDDAKYFKVDLEVI